MYYLDVYAIGNDQRLPLGTSEYTTRSDELFKQEFSFNVSKHHPHIGKRIALALGIAAEMFWIMLL